jgi:hypothetical protein
MYRGRPGVRLCPSSHSRSIDPSCLLNSAAPSRLR